MGKTGSKQTILLVTNFLNHIWWLKPTLYEVQYQFAQLYVKKILKTIIFKKWE